MKHYISKSLLMSSLYLLSACGGGGGGSSPQKTAQIPAAPQGQISVNTDNFCELANNRITCHTLDTKNQACTVVSKNSFSDVKTMCEQVTIMLQETGFGVACSPTAALNKTYTDFNCATVLGQQNGLPPVVPPATPWPPGVPNEPYMKMVRCDFEAYRVYGDHFKLTVPQSSLTEYFDGRTMKSISLRKSIFGIDPGGFGDLKLIYKPLNPITKKTQADTFTLVSTGLNKNKNMSFSQLGYAGRPLQMDILSDDGCFELRIKCESASIFNKSQPATQYKNYRCKGESSLYGAEREKIDVLFPYDASIVNTELQIGNNFTAVVDADKGGDNARITFTAIGAALGTSIKTSAYLKSTSTIKAGDSLSNLEVTCSPE